MSRRPLELTHGRSRYVVLPRSQVKPRPTELAARHLVDEVLREGGVAAAAGLERLAEGLVGRPADGLREVVRIVVRALVEGTLVVVEPPRATRILTGEEATDLRTLGGWEPAQPLRPREPTPIEPTTWISFEVVDERGVPANGHYRLTLDAGVEAAELARRGHRYDGLREGAPMQLAVEELAWDDTTPWPNAPGRNDDPRPADDGLFSLELVDERGEPLHGQFRLTEGDRLVAEGVLAHRWRRALPSGEPLALALTELRTDVESR